MVIVGRKSVKRFNDNKSKQIENVFPELINYNRFSIAANQNSLKYISLITLTLQNAILGLSMRYGRTRPGDMFLSSTGKISNYSLAAAPAIISNF